MAGISNIGKDKLILDTSDLTNSDNVGAYVRSSDGTLITHTTDGAKECLDVNVCNQEEGGNHNEDDVHTSGDTGSFALGVRSDAGVALAADGDYIPFMMNSTGDLNVQDDDAIAELVLANASLDVIEAATHLEDAGHVTGDRGMFALAVRNDADAVLTSADLDYSPISVDSAGRLKLAADLDVDFSYDEDSVHADGDKGAYVLSVRQDTLASSVSADGDYASFKINDRGGLWTVPVGTVADDAADDENPVKVGSRSVDGLLATVADGDRADLLSDSYRRIWVNKAGNVAISAAASTVGIAEVELAAVPTGGRISILVQNLGSKPIFLGPTGVTTASGIALAPRANVSLDLGEDVNIFAISGTAGQDVRVMELA